MNEELTSRAAPSSQAIAACGQQKGLPRYTHAFSVGAQLLRGDGEMPAPRPGALYDCRARVARTKAADAIASGHQTL